MQKENLVSLFLRLGLAFSFLYAAISGFITPESWIGFFPVWMRDLAPFSDELLLHIFSSFEILLSLFILFQKKPFIASIVGAIALFGIVVVNLGALDIVFRDIGLFFMAIALAVLSKKQTTNSLEPTTKGF